MSLFLHTHSQTRVILLHNRITVYLLLLGVFLSVLKAFINSLVGYFFLCRHWSYFLPDLAVCASIAMTEGGLATDQIARKQASNTDI